MISSNAFALIFSISSSSRNHMEKLKDFEKRLRESTEKSQVVFSVREILCYCVIHLCLGQSNNPKEIRCFLCLYDNTVPLKLQNLKDYLGIIEFSKTSIETKELGADLIPRYFQFYTSHSNQAFDAYKDIIEAVDVNLTVCT